jgi:hypothetical protein
MAERINGFAARHVATVNDEGGRSRFAPPAIPDRRRTSPNRPRRATVRVGAARDQEVDREGVGGNDCRWP